MCTKNVHITTSVVNMALHIETNHTTISQSIVICPINTSAINVKSVAICFLVHAKSAIAN